MINICYLHISLSSPSLCPSFLDGVSAAFFWVNLYAVYLALANRLHHAYPIAFCIKKRYIQSDPNNIPRFTKYFASCLFHYLGVLLNVIYLNNYRGILRRFVITFLEKTSVYCTWLFWTFSSESVVVANT